jgi:hypothetical protein
MSLKNRIYSPKQHLLVPPAQARGAGDGPQGLFAGNTANNSSGPDSVLFVVREASDSQGKGQPYTAADDVNLEGDASDQGSLLPIQRGDQGAMLSETGTDQVPVSAHTEHDREPERSHPKAPQVEQKCDFKLPWLAGYRQMVDPSKIHPLDRAWFGCYVPPTMEMVWH